MCADWSKAAWRSRPRVQMPDYPDAAGARGGRGAARLLSAAGLRRRGAQAQGAARARLRGQGVPAPGRRLRRELRRVQRRQHPRHLQGDAADGGGPDLRRQGAGGEGRPHRRPVRQAPLGRHRDRGRRGASLLPRRHHQRLRVRSRGAGARPGADAAGLHPVRRHAEPPARLQPGRLRRHHPHPFLDARLHRRAVRLRAVPQARQPHLRGAGVRRRRRGQPGDGGRAAPGRLLHLARGAACSSTRRRSAASTRRPACRWRARGT